MDKLQHRAFKPQLIISVSIIVIMIISSIQVSLRVNSTGIVVDTVDSQYVTYSNSQRKIVRDSNGYLYVAYPKEDETGINQIFLAKSTDNGNTWLQTWSQISTGTTASSAPGIAIDSTDTIHVVWSKATTTYDEIYYNYCTVEGTVGTQHVISEFSAYGHSCYPTIAVDGNNWLHVAWYDVYAGANHIRYRKYTTNDWQDIETLHTSSIALYNPAIAIDSSNNAHLAWYSYDDTTDSYNQIWYTRWTGTTWATIEQVSDYGAYGGVAWYPSIAIDTNDCVHVVWEASFCTIHGNQPSSAYMINYRQKQATESWSNTPYETTIYCPGIDGGGLYRYKPSLSIDSNDELYVMFYKSDLEIYKNVFTASTGWNDEIQITSTSINRYVGTRWAKFYNFYPAIIDYCWTAINGSNYDVMYDRFTPMNTVPNLTYSIEPGYDATDGINPEIGTTATNFVYKVVYFDNDNDPPINIKLFIDDSQTGYNMNIDLSADIQLHDGNYTNGEQYTYTTTLPPGTHTYHFECSDGIDFARLPAIADAQGPTVTSVNEPATITVLEPDGVDDVADTTYTIVWADNDPDDNATIILYYDNDLAPGGEVLICTVPQGEDSTDDSFVWDTTDIPEGTYYINASISDGINPPDYDYSDGPVTIVHPQENHPPYPPTEILPDSTADHTPLISWSGASDPDGDLLVYYIQLGTYSGGNDVLSWYYTGTNEYYQVSMELEDGIYYVQVIANDSQLSSEVHEETMIISFASNSPPEPPSAIYPDLSFDKTPHIWWEGASDPDGDTITYYIQIGLSHSGNEILSWYYTGENSSYEVTESLAVNAYYVQVPAHDGLQYSQVHEELLYIDNTAPEPPGMILPDSTADRTPRISWYGASDADPDDKLTYKLQIGTTSGGDELLPWLFTGASEYYDVTIELLPGTYYVQVMAYDNIDYSPVHEEPMEITISGNTPPEPPREILPDVTYDKTPTINWSGATDVDNDPLTYYIQLGTAHALGDIIAWRAVGNKEYYNITIPLAVGIYYVQLKANDGFENSTTLEETMEVKNRAPTPPRSILPDTTTDRSPLISWYGAVDPDPGDMLYYYIQIGTESLANDTLKWYFTATATHYQVVGELPVGTYWVQIKATDCMVNSSVHEETLNITEKLLENIPPNITIIAPPAGGTIADETYIIAWVDSDPDDNASITLYYDTDMLPGGETLIGKVPQGEDSDNNTYIWNTSAVPAGNYYINASITDGINVPVYNYSTATVNITHKLFDVVPPQIVFIFPSCNATNVNVATIIGAQFNEPINASTVNPATIYVTDQNGAKIDGELTYDELTFTVRFTPSRKLLYNTRYTVVISGICDLAGNSITNYSWSFTTMLPSPAPKVLHDDFLANAFIIAVALLSAILVLVIILLYIKRKRKYGGFARAPASQPAAFERGKQWHRDYTGERRRELHMRVYQRYPQDRSKKL
jgi:hypothetical protein